MTKDTSKRWAWNQPVRLFDIRKKWPQLINWEDGRALYCNRSDYKEFDLLRYIVLADGEETLTPSEFVPLVVKFKVASWPKPKELYESGLNWSSLDADQKQRYTYLAYWLGINNKPLNPRRHAPIKQDNYVGSTGTYGAVGMVRVRFQATNNPRGICKRWGKN